MLLTVLGIRVPDGPLGPFAAAQVRLSCRSGARARALALRTVVSGPAAEVLSAGWGFGGGEDAVLGSGAPAVVLERGYDRVRLSAPGLEVDLVDPSPLGRHDVQHVVGLHRVRTSDAGERLAQVEIDLEPERAERGRPRCAQFDAADWGDHRLHLAHPVAASLVVGRLTLPVLRYLLPLS